MNDAMRNEFKSKDYEKGESLQTEEVSEQSKIEEAVVEETSDESVHLVGVAFGALLEVQEDANKVRQRKETKGNERE